MKVSHYTEALCMAITGCIMYKWDKWLHIHNLKTQFTAFNVCGWKKRHSIWSKRAGFKSVVIFCRYMDNSFRTTDSCLCKDNDNICFKLLIKIILLFFKQWFSTCYMPHCHKQHLNISSFNLHHKTLRHVYLSSESITDKETAT
jgi:hypothetical protein